MAKSRIVVGPEVQILSGGLQPFMFRSAAGTLVVQAQLVYPVGWVYPEKNIFPGLPGTIVSRDGGQTWELWKPGKDQGQGPIFEGGVVQLANGTIRVFEWIADGPSPDGYFTGAMWDSHDEWRTVQGPTPMRIYMPEGKGGFDDGGRPYSGTTFHRTVLELPNGSLLAAIYCWFKADSTPSTYEPKMNRYRCVLLRSDDQGHNWRYISTIAAEAKENVGEEGFDEPVMVRLSQGPKAGRLVCLMRTGSKVDPIFQAHSDDEGATWSPARPLPLKGVDPDLIEMQNGVLACSYGYRVMTPGAADHGNYVAFSSDQGETWGDATLLPIEAHSGVQRSTCYTSLREVEPGKLIVAYDIGWWGWPVRYVGRRIVRVELGRG